MKIGNAGIEFVRGDITDVTADAIVNAANSRLAGGGGVDGAIHRIGGPSITQECSAIGGCPTGGAVATGAGDLKARYVIHAVAPVYSGLPKDALLLASAYAMALSIAEERGLQSIAFPSLGTGAYRYPIDEAAAIALRTVADHLRSGSSIERVTFVLFSDADLESYRRAAGRIASQNAP
ncbi:MAG TPA: O-acetyl-ADP-ribose deacetylase [Candidatus Tumulicola sp.]|nr:O-acetyl-ADP-ribose deacetylase [Candidatus Tumulicola sp.]